MLKLYYCRLPDSTPAVQTERLSAYRREKIEKQTNERVRLRSLTAELLLRHALRDGGFAVEGPLNIVVSEQGKPFLRDGRCFFSLSHSETEGTADDPEDELPKTCGWRWIIFRQIELITSFMVNSSKDFPIEEWNTI